MRGTPRAISEADHVVGYSREAEALLRFSALREAACSASRLNSDAAEALEFIHLLGCFRRTQRGGPRLGSFGLAFRVFTCGRPQNGYTATLYAHVFDETYLVAESST